MMRRRPLRESLTALIIGACLFVAWGGDAVGAHSCPHHDAVPESGNAGPATGSVHAAHHASSTREQHSGATHDHGGPCTCVGACHASAEALAPSADAAQLVEIAGWSQGRHFQERDGFRVVALPYVLPYANAPPPAS